MSRFLPSGIACALLMIASLSACAFAQDTFPDALGTYPDRYYYPGSVLDDRVFDDLAPNENSHASGFARGGGLYFESGTHTLTTVTVSNNQALYSSPSGSGGAMGGGLYFAAGTPGSAVTIGASAIIGNAATSNSYGTASIAQGGGIYFATGTLTVHGSSVSNNRVYLGSSFASGVASGGGLYITHADATIEDTVIEGNIVSSGSNGSALGGGIYFDYGTLTIVDSAIRNNRVQGNDARGSAIFVNMEETPTGSDTTIVNLYASAGKTVEISGNVANGTTYSGGITFGNADLQNGLSNYHAEFNLQGGGDFVILNPLQVALNNGKNFTMTKEAGTGNLTWDGYNTFTADQGTVDITLSDGVITLGDHFSLIGFDHTGANRTTTNMSVTLDNVRELSFSLSRDTDLALFDFSGINGTKEFTVTPKTALTATLGREVKSFHNQDYLIVAGLEDEDIDTSWFNLKTNNPYTTQSLIDNEDGDLWARISYHSPFDVTQNSRNAQDALESLVKTGSYADRVSDAEFAAMVASANNITAELYVEHGFVAVNATDRLARTAVDMGLRFAQRERLKNATLGITGGTIEDDYGYYGYPNLVDCDAPGLRLWGGYVGEWTNASARHGFNGYKVDRNGFILGGTRDFGDMASVGLYGGYTYASVAGRRADADIKSDMGHFGIVARFSPITHRRELSFYGDAGYHYAANDSYRRLAGYDAKGSFHQRVFTVGGGAEYVICRENYSLIPRAEGRFLNIDQDRLTESGSSSTIAHMAGYDKNYFLTRLGIEATGEFMAGEMVVSPSASVDWRHDFGDRQLSSQSSYIHDPASIMYNVVSRRYDRDSLDIGVGMTAYRTVGASSFAVNLGYNLNVSRNSDTHTLYAGIEVGF